MGTASKYLLLPSGISDSNQRNKEKKDKFVRTMEAAANATLGSINLPCPPSNLTVLYFLESVTIVPHN